MRQPTGIYYILSNEYWETPFRFFIIDEFGDSSSNVDEWEKVKDELRQARDNIVCAMLEMGNGHKLVGTISVLLVKEQQLRHKYEH